MRKDMVKVIERPRVGGCGKKQIRKNRHAAKRDPENTDCITSMKRIHSLGGYEETKEKNQNWSIVKKFLRSRVGRKWDDVYSEIMENINTNSTPQYNVWQAFVGWNGVETNTYMENSRVMVADNFGGWCVETAYHGETFYVHPLTGLLCYTDSKSYGNKNSVYEVRNRCVDPHNKNVQYHKLGDIWYEITVREGKVEVVESVYKSPYGKNTWKNYRNNIFMNVSERRLFDEIVKNNTNTWWQREQEDLYQVKNYLFGIFVPVSKRQLNTKEIRRVEAMIDSKYRKHAA